jgi:transcription termination factor NusB
MHIGIEQVMSKREEIFENVNNLNQQETGNRSLRWGRLLNNFLKTFKDLKKSFRDVACKAAAKRQLKFIFPEFWFSLFTCAIFQKIYVILFLVHYNYDSALAEQEKTIIDAFDEHTEEKIITVPYNLNEGSKYDEMLDQILEKTNTWTRNIDDVLSPLGFHNVSLVFKASYNDTLTKLRSRSTHDYEIGLESIEHYGFKATHKDGYESIFVGSGSMDELLHSVVHGDGFISLNFRDDLTLDEAYDLDEKQKSQAQSQRFTNTILTNVLESDGGYFAGELHVNGYGLAIGQ